MKSIWDAYREDLKEVECDWCCLPDKPLYEFEQYKVCQECLKTEEYEEPYHGLTNEERNA